MNDFPRAAERGKHSCFNSSALPRRITRRITRRIAVVRRDRAHNPPRTDRSPAEHGT